MINLIMKALSLINLSLILNSSHIVKELTYSFKYLDFGRNLQNFHLFVTATCYNQIISHLFLSKSGFLQFFQNLLEGVS